MMCIVIVEYFLNRVDIGWSDASDQWSDASDADEDDASISERECSTSILSFCVKMYPTISEKLF